MFKIRKPLKLPPPHIVKKHIADLQSIDLRTADIEFLKFRLTPLFRGYFLSTITIRASETIYRGIQWEKKPTSVKELSYPPVEAITSHQRVNRPHRPMFYSSIAREAPFFELDLKAGDHVAISKWRTNRKIWVNNVGYVHYVFDRLNSNRPLPTWRRPESPFSSKSNRIVDEFFSTEFSKVVPTGQEHQYKMSVAIAEKLYLGELKLDPTHELIEAEPRFGGLIYPAIAMRANADNITLLPEFVDRYLELSSVEWIRVDAHLSDLKYQVTTLDFANSIGTEGEIQWKGRLPQWEIHPGQQVTVSVENGKYIVRNDKGEVLDPS